MELNCVRRSAELVYSQATHVCINRAAIEKAVQELSVADVNKIASPKAFDAELHFQDGTPLTAQYLLVLDALNFCFWPDKELEYGDWSKGLRDAVIKDPTVLDADKLASITEAQVRELCGWKRDLPQQEERARLIREVGSVLRAHFGGQAANLIAAANKSALQVVSLVTSHFPGFRDHCIYKGQQVFLYKRAQIFVGDVYGAYEGKGLGEFHDIDQLTMFADYRVPVVLRVIGILEYVPALEAKIQSQQEICAGSEEEVEIRAATIVAVEQLKAALHERFQSQPGVEALPMTLQLDWWLWDIGERARSSHPPPHHTLTIYY